MLAALVQPSVKADVSWTPLDSRWYHEIGGMRADAGIVVVPQSALEIAVVYRAVNVLAHSIASIPLPVYRRLGDNGKEQARDHPQYRLLHDQPNPWMTSFRWRHLLGIQMLLWGNHYSQIMPGPGAIGQLAPLNPDTTRIVDQLSDGRLVYLTQDRQRYGLGDERKLLQDDVFHVRGFSIDGKAGIPLTRLARNAMGLALMAEKHGSMFLRRGARFNGFLSTEQSLDPKVRKELEDAWAGGYSGPGGTGKTPLMTAGMTFQNMSSNNRDSQWIEGRTFQVEELLRFLGVPGVLVGYADKTSTYASAEQFFLSFVTHSVRPHTENIASEMNFSVITDPENYFAEFKLEGLLKGDIKTRYTSHKMAIESGWKTRNEVRIEESYNRGPEELDEFIVPLNMGSTGDEDADEDEDGDGARAIAPRRSDRDSDEEARRTGSNRLAAIAGRTVERLVHREMAAIFGNGDRLGAAARYADNPDGWRDWLRSFYISQSDHIIRDLGIHHEAANAYCEAQSERFLSLSSVNGSAESDSIAALARLVPELNTETAA